MKPVSRASVLAAYLATKWRLNRWKSRAKFESWQKHLLTRHLGWIANRSPYYRDRRDRRSLDPAELETWPIMDKAVMMRNLGSLLTCELCAGERSEINNSNGNHLPTLPEFAIGASSGTSGRLGRFIVSMGEQAFWAGAVLAKVLRTSLLAPHRIALFLRANNQLYHAVANSRIRLNFFDLGDSFEELLRKLADFQPTVLVGPPRLLVRIAHLIVEASYPIRPQQVVSAAEVLDPGDRELIQSAFGVPVDEVYQATEGFLAATCRFGRLHWNEDIVLIEREPIGHGRFLPIITDFRRRTQPIIRYRLDDVIIESDSVCPCGSIFRPIGKIEGRADDLLKLHSIDNQRGTGMLFPDFVRLAVATASPYLQDFKVTQTRLDRIEIALLPELPTEASRAEFLTHFENTLAKICEPNGLVLPECVLMPWRAEPPTQKQRRVRSLVN